MNDSCQRNRHDNYAQSIGKQVAPAELISHRRHQVFRHAAATPVAASLRKLSTLCVNCESTSSAISMISGSIKLKSTLPKFRWMVSKIDTCRILDSCTIRGAV